MNGDRLLCCGVNGLSCWTRAMSVRRLCRLVGGDDSSGFWVVWKPQSVLGKYLAFVIKDIILA